MFSHYFNKPKKGTAALIGTVKNEGPWLLEWIAHNKVIGFDEIAIASNDCTDGTAQILDQMETMGLLTHIDNPGPYKRTIQMDAYYALQNLPNIKRCEWVMPLDADEFLVVHTGDNKVKDMIELGKDCDRIPIQWRTFGDNGLRGFIDLPITDHLTMASRLDNPNNGFYKTLVKDHRHYEMNVLFTSVWQPHARFGLQRFKNLKFYCDGIVLTIKQGRPLKTILYPIREVTFKNIYAQVNHYAVRSSELCALKFVRGDVNGNEGKESHQEYYKRLNLNQETDISALNYRDERQELIEKWLQNETLSSLYQQTIETVKNKISKLKTS